MNSADFSTATFDSQAYRGRRASPRHVQLTDWPAASSAWQSGRWNSRSSSLVPTTINAENPLDRSAHRGLTRGSSRATSPACLGAGDQERRVGQDLVVRIEGHG